MMEQARVDLRVLKAGVNRILDHITEDLGVTEIALEESLYWLVGYPERHDMSKDPRDLLVGDLRDDWEFVSTVPEGDGLPVVYQLTEIAQLLDYIGHSFEQFGDRPGGGCAGNQ